MTSSAPWACARRGRGGRGGWQRVPHAPARRQRPAAAPHPQLGGQPARFLDKIEVDDVAGVNAGQRGQPLALHQPWEEGGARGRVVCARGTGGGGGGLAPTPDARGTAPARALTHEPHPHALPLHQHGAPHARSAQRLLARRAQHIAHEPAACARRAQLFKILNPACVGERGVGAVHALRCVLARPPCSHPTRPPTHP